LSERLAIKGAEGTVFQSDGHNPIDLSAFHAEAAPPPVAVRPKLRLPRTRRPAAPVRPEPPGLPKPAKAPKTPTEPKVRDKDRKKEKEPPIAVPPPGTWPPGPMPEQVSLPASIAYVVWKVAVIAAVAAFFLVKFLFQLALLPFMRMLD
jgi:hypothetical protein